MLVWRKWEKVCVEWVGGRVAEMLPNYFMHPSSTGCHIGPVFPFIIFIIIAIIMIIVITGGSRPLCALHNSLLPLILNSPHKHSHKQTLNNPPPNSDSHPISQLTFSQDIKLLSTWIPLVTWTIVEIQRTSIWSGNSLFRVHPILCSYICYPRRYLGKIFELNYFFPWRTTYCITAVTI